MELARSGNDLSRQLSLRVPEPANLVGQLPPHSTVIQFAVSRYPLELGEVTRESSGGLRYSAFVLRCDEAALECRVAWVQIGPVQPIDDAIALWRSEIAGKQHGTTPDKPPAQFLREELWAKIEPHLAGSSMVIIVPDGDLPFLPWGALPGREPSTCLLEDYALATVPNVHQLFNALTEPQNTDGGTLLVGDVQFDTEPTAIKPPAAHLAQDRSASDNLPGRGPAMRIRPTWPALIGTARELEEIQKLQKNTVSQPHVLRGSTAGEDALRQKFPGNRYVHLATHGFFANESFRSMFVPDEQGVQLFGGMELVTATNAYVTTRNPLILSGIVLAGANLPPKTDELGLPTGEDGVLTAEEIVNLDLRGTELVVLSACETGLGKVAGGEGLMGLTRAFHLAVRAMLSPAYGKWTTTPPPR